MKKYIIAFLITSVVAVGAVFAISGNTNGRFFGKNREEFASKMFDRVSTKFNMTEEQKTQAKTILEDSKTRVEPLMEKMEQNREASKNLGTDGVFDEAKATEIANEQSETAKQLFLEKEKTKANLFAVLNTDQRERAKKMIDEFGNHFKNGSRKGFGEKSEAGF